LVLIDVGLPGVNGIAAVRELRRRAPEQKILVLSMYADEDFVAQALTAGALGYALKDQSQHEIIDAIRAVARGQAYLLPRISRVVLEDYLRMHRGEKGPVG